jgi:hypothetical protein
VNGVQPRAKELPLDPGWLERGVELADGFRNLIENLIPYMTNSPLEGFQFLRGDSFLRENDQLVDLIIR